MSLLTRLQCILKEADAGPLDKKTLTVQQIADKHGVSVDAIEQQVKKGITVEKEHTSSEAAAREIALDHLAEVPDYYDKLKKVEEQVTMSAGQLPDRGMMPAPFPVLNQHIPNDPRFLDAPLRRVPLQQVHATQRTVDAENVKRFIDDPTLGGKPVVALHDKGYAIVDGHHRLAAARLRGETYALAHVVEDAPAMAAGHGAVAGLGVGPQGEPGVMLPRKRKIDEDTKLWKYNRRTGYWDLQRTITNPHDEQRWLSIFQKDEPSEVFKLSKNRPSDRPLRLGALRFGMHEDHDTFAGADVFDTDTDLVAIKEPKKRWERYAKYVGVEEEGESIRQHARRTKRDIILRDSKTGTMTWLRKRGWHK